VIAFCTDMPALYADSDLVIARAGAMTVSEVAATGLPAIFIPLPHAADNHQFHNAMALAARGGVEIIEQDECEAGALAEHVARTLFDRERLQSMSRAAAGLLPENGENRLLRVLQPWLEAPA